MSVLARVRQRLARSPWIYWAAVGALALLVGVFVAQATSGVEAARDSWGETRSVVVAIADIAPGDALARATEVRSLPSRMVPDAAAGEVAAGALARQRITAGEVLVAHDIAPVDGPQALIPEGWLAVPVAEPVASGAVPGDDVQVASGGIVLAADGLVVAVTPDATLVAVPAPEAPQVAHAATTGDVALLLSG